MALRNILVDPDPVLRKICRPVKSVTPHIAELIEDMKETMVAADGVGLAAPQVGVLRRIAIIKTGEEFIELINPVIISAEGEQTGEEACLSVPDRSGIVTRPMKVVVESDDREGNRVTYEGEGLFARAVCHELAHLDGGLFIDVMTREIFDDEDKADFIEAEDDEGTVTD